MIPEKRTKARRGTSLPADGLGESGVKSDAEYQREAERELAEYLGEHYEEPAREVRAIDRIREGDRIAHLMRQSMAETLAALKTTTNESDWFKPR